MVISLRKQWRFIRGAYETVFGWLPKLWKCVDIAYSCCRIAANVLNKTKVGKWRLPYLGGPAGSTLWPCENNITTRRRCRHLHVDSELAQSCTPSPPPFLTTFYAPECYQGAVRQEFYVCATALSRVKLWHGVCFDIWRSFCCTPTRSVSSPT